MSNTKPTPVPTEAFNDVLARMMQAEVNEGGPPPATPCDTPVESPSRIQIVDSADALPEAKGSAPISRQDFELTLTERLDRLRDQIHEMQTASVKPRQAAASKRHDAMADLEAKQEQAREQLAALTQASGAAWEGLRDSAKCAWDELDKAIRQARSAF